MLKVFRHFPSFVTVALGLACSGTTSPKPRLVEIVTKQQAVVRGSSVEVEVRNATNEVLSYSLCGFMIERKIADRWSLFEQYDGPCADILNPLQPGATVSRTLLIRANAEPGSYRIIFPGIHRKTVPDLEASERISNEFAVTQ